MAATTADDPANGDLDIKNNTSVTITGAGSGITTINANSIDRAFAVQADAGLTLSGLTIENGSPNTISSGTVTLLGRVTSGGQRTTYRFQYGATKSYGKMTPAQSTSAAASVRATITALTPGRRYHFRLVASNPSGAARGCRPDARRRVTPSERASVRQAPGGTLSALSLRAHGNPAAAQGGDPRPRLHRQGRDHGSERRRTADWSIACCGDTVRHRMFRLLMILGSRS